MTLYHCMSARSFRPLWMLEELGLPYELKMLPFPPRVKAPSYLEINPLGAIPAFFDGAARMTESAAICHFLAARHSPRQLNVEVDEVEFGVYLNFLHFGEATLTFPQTLVLGSPPWLTVRATDWISRVRPHVRNTRRTMVVL